MPEPISQHELMNMRSGAWGLVNGQLVHYGRPATTVVDHRTVRYVDDTKIDRFVKHTFKLR